MEKNANNVKDIQGTLNTSYSSLKKFVSRFFEGIINTSQQESRTLLNFIINVVENSEFPFILLLNEQDSAAILISLFYTDGQHDLITKLMQKCIEKLNFESRGSSSIEYILNAASSLGIPSDCKQREPTNIEKIYLEYKSIMTDCQFFKNYLEEIINEDYDEHNLLEILKRIKQIISTNYNVNDANYPIYIYDFLQQLSQNLSNYEDYFIKKLREIKKDSLYTPFSSSIQKNNSIKDLSQIDIRQRTSFYYEELLAIEEGLHVEYKDYRWPLSSNLIETLKNQICGFLNSQGGRVYIGVSDDRIVKGVYLKPKKKDLIRNQITNYTSDFWPKCRTSKIDVMFIPVKTKNKSEEKYLENIYVIKIIIRQGDVNKLYSSISKGINAYVRLPGQCVLLSAEEITDEIVRRKENPKNGIEDSAYADPQPENPNENFIPNNKNNIDIKTIFTQLNKKGEIKKQDSFKNKPNTNTNIANLSPSEKGININKQLEDTYTLSIQGIPRTVRKSEIVELLKDTFYSSERVFVDANGFCQGWAFVNYPNKVSAEFTMKKLKGVSIGGVKLSVKLKQKNEI